MAEVKCGHCKTRHEAAGVKECARVEWERRAADEEGHLQARAEAAAELHHERWLEDGGAHSEIIAWEHEQGRLRAPFDPQDAHFDRLIQEREQREDEAVARFKADRDARVLAGRWPSTGRARRQRPF